MGAVDLLKLPVVFTHAQASAAGISDRALYTWRDSGAVDVLARGIFTRPDYTGDPDLTEITTRAPRATLCLSSALAHHGLTDEIPSVIDVALPRNQRPPRPRPRGIDSTNQPWISDGPNSLSSTTSRSGSSTQNEQSSTSSGYATCTVTNKQSKRCAATFAMPGNRRNSLQSPATFRPLNLRCAAQWRFSCEPHTGPTNARSNEVPPTPVTLAHSVTEGCLA